MIHLRDLTILIQNLNRLAPHKHFRIDRAYGGFRIEDETYQDALGTGYTTKRRLYDCASAAVAFHRSLKR